MRVWIRFGFVLLIVPRALSAQEPDPGTAEAAIGATVLALAQAWTEAWNERDAERMINLHDHDLQYLLERQAHVSRDLRASPA